jgi:hypothetical protein
MMFLDNLPEHYSEEYDQKDYTGNHWWVRRELNPRSTEATVLQTAIANQQQPLTQYLTCRGEYLFCQ